MAQVNGVPPAGAPLELAIDVPHSPGLRINLHLTILANAVMLFLATTTIDSGDATASMGSLVYAIPDRYNPTQPLSTPLYTLPSTIDAATRMAKVLARRLQRPVYVGGGMNLSGAPAGGSVEEETLAFRAVVDAVVKACAK